MFTQAMTAPNGLAEVQKNVPTLLYAVASSGLALSMCSMTAFADASMDAALNSVFDALEGIAGTVQSGITGIVLPIGVAVCLYFVVRMILASDTKDAAMYKKRAITVAILVAVAFAIPGLMQAMSSLGNSVNDALTASSSATG